MADHCPRWMWRDPYEIIERLLAKSAASGPDVSRGTSPVRPCRDRHYTQARRLRIRTLMKGIR